MCVDIVGTNQQIYIRNWRPTHGKCNQSKTDVVCWEIKLNAQQVLWLAADILWPSVAVVAAEKCLLSLSNAINYIAVKCSEYVHFLKKMHLY